MSLFASLKSIEAFLSAHASTTDTLSSVFDGDATAKRSALAQLLQLAQRDAACSEQCLKALKVLCRDTQCLEALFEPHALQWLLDTVQLDAPFAPASDAACTVLVNLLVADANDVLLDFLCARDVPLRLFDAIFAERFDRGDDHALLASLFVRYRMLFQWCGKRESIRDALLRRGALCALQRRVQVLAGSGAASGGAAAVRPCLGELLRCCFMCTLSWGPLGSSPLAKVRVQVALDDESRRAWFALLGFARAVYRDKDAPRLLRAAAISCTLNAPLDADETRHMLQVGAGAEPSDAALLAQHLYTIIDPTLTDKAEATTLLMVLCRMASALAAVRSELRELLFPRELYARDKLRSGVTQPYAERKCLTNAIVALMAHANAGLSHYAAELLYTVCDQDKEEFTRVVGFGCAAGLLAMKGFLNVEENAINKTVEQQQPAELSERAKELIRQFQANPEGESEEHKVIRQGRALHELEKLGIVNFVRKKKSA